MIDDEGDGRNDDLITTNNNMIMAAITTAIMERLLPHCDDGIHSLVPNASLSFP
jgi:hypothetical protein